MEWTIQGLLASGKGILAAEESSRARIHPVATFFGGTTFREDQKTLVYAPVVPGDEAACETT